MSLTRDQLIQKFSPVVYIHPKEKYYPCNIEWLLRYSTLVDFNLPADNPKRAIVSPTNQDLYDAAARYNFERRVDGDLILSFPPGVYGGQRPLSDVKTYCLPRTKDGKIYLTYIFVFAYNGEYSIANLRNVGQHPGDIEHITLELNIDQTLSRVFFSAHGTKDGRWVKASDVEMEDGRVVAYNAMNGHGLYPTDGVVFRLGGFGNDFLSKGPRWAPTAELIVPRSDPDFNPATMGWTVFYGRFGGEPKLGNTAGISGLADKAWVRDIDNPNAEAYKPPKIYNMKTSGLAWAGKQIVKVIAAWLVLFWILKKVSKATYVSDINLSHHLTVIVIALIGYLVWKNGGNALIKKYVPE